jgi:copper(I)-binding protein
MKHPALFALCAALAVSGCQQQAQQPADPSPEAKPGLALSEGRLVLPAVSGRPAAAYFTLSNGGPAPAVLAAVHVEGADKAEMHETKGGSMAPLASLEVKVGETVRFEPGGKHVMAFGLKPELAAGGTSEMTLTFADGDKLSAPLKLEARGEAADHGGSH